MLHEQVFKFGLRTLIQGISNLLPTLSSTGEMSPFNLCLVAHDKSMNSGPNIPCLKNPFRKQLPHSKFISFLYQKLLSWSKEEGLGGSSLIEDYALARLKEGFWFSLEWLQWAKLLTLVILFGTVINGENWTQEGRWVIIALIMSIYIYTALLSWQRISYMEYLTWSPDVF